MINLYNEINKRINTIDFSVLWNGFKPYKFALYNDKEVYLDGEVFEIDQRFLGNTSIKYNDEFIAIWKINENTYDYDDLASKIVHEMFHAFQNDNNETRWPNEIFGLKYNYIVDNLSIKYKENEILVNLIESFNTEKYIEFLQLRKYREKNYNFEFTYEMKTEVVEGIAEYVELKALKQLNENKYNKKIESLKKEILNYNNLLPIRMVSYHIGSLLLLMCDDNNIRFDHRIGVAKETIYELLSKDIKYTDVTIDNHKLLSKSIESFNKKNEECVKDVLNNSTNRLIGKYQIMGLDPLNTVRYKGYLYCRHFFAYMDDEIKFLQNECVVKVDDSMNALEIVY